MLKRIAILIAFGSLLMGSGAIAHASTATDQFLSDAEAAGFFNGNGNAAEVQVGQAVCVDLSKGVSQSDEAHFLWVNSGMSQDMATQFVQLAAQDLCPKSEVT